jgi:hypothetical protein
MSKKTSNSSGFVKSSLIITFFLTNSIKKGEKNITMCQKYREAAEKN